MTETKPSEAGELEAFSPPVVKMTIMGTKLVFRRLNFDDDWKVLKAEIIEDLIRESRIDLNKLAEKMPPAERVAAFRALKDYIKTTLPIRKLMHDCYSEPDYIDKVLKRCLIEGNPEHIRLIPENEKAEIAEELVCMPWIPPESQNPPTPPSGTADSAGENGNGGQTTSPIQTGQQEQG